MCFHIPVAHIYPLHFQVEMGGFTLPARSQQVVSTTVDLKAQLSCAIRPTNCFFFL